MLAAAVIQRNVAQHAHDQDDHHHDERPSTGSGRNRRDSNAGDAFLMPGENGGGGISPRQEGISPTFEEEEFGAIAPEATPEREEMTVKEIIHGLVSGFSLERPAPSECVDWASLIITNFIYLVIGVSVVAFGVETLPEFRNGNKALDIIEAVCVAIFTVEVIIRCASCPSQKDFWLNPLTWIDILSIVPYYILLFVNTDGAGQFILMIRILRLIRIIRVFKLVKNNIGFAAVFESLISSKEALSLMAFMLLVAVATFSAAIYFAELDGNTFDESSKKWIRPNGEVNPFQSLFHACWWCVITITTVGYGDEVPITGAGKAIASFAAIAGVFVISFPTAILGANFADIHSKKVAERDEKLRRLKKLGAVKKKGVLDAGDAVAVMPLVPPDGDTPSDTRPLSPTADAGIMLSMASPLDGTVNGEGSRNVKKILHYSYVEGAPPRDVLLSPGVATYNPVLMLQAEPADPSVVHAKSEEAYPPGAKMLTMNLILASAEASVAVAESLRQARINPEKLLIIPRGIETLRVKADLPSSVADACRLTVSEFIKPIAVVPLTFYILHEEAEIDFLSQISAISLKFEVTYEAPANLSLPLSLYTRMHVGKVKRPQVETGAKGGQLSMSQSMRKAPSQPSKAVASAAPNTGNGGAIVNNQQSNNDAPHIANGESVASNGSSTHHDGTDDFPHRESRSTPSSEERDRKPEIE